MGKNIFDVLKPKADLSRNGFDLSQRHVWSQKVAQIVPCLTIDCVPGDYHEIDLLSLTRTLPVKTDAFTRLKLYYTAFFVPYQQNWFKWNEFIAQTREKFSTLDTGTIGYVPRVSLKALLQEIVYYLLNASENDLFGFNYGLNALRMLDMLGYGSYYRLLSLVEGNTAEADALDTYLNAFDGKYINLFRVMAYQKICNDFFRNNQYTVADPELFNADDVTSTGILDASVAAKMFATIWYRQWRKDMFTSLFASPQFGSVSTVDLTSVKIVADSFSGSNMNTRITPNGKLANYATGFTENTDFTVPAAFDVYAMRKAEVLQKWKEDKLRAGNKLKDQALAMFGQRPRYLTDHYSDFIKEVDVNVSIDEVINMASGSDVLGEIGGKGIGTGNGHFQYSTDDFGTLMIVASIVPIQEYDATQLEKQNTMIEPFDFFTPHFEDLGFESVSLYQLRNDPRFGGRSITGDLNRVIGYSPRYSYYKTAIDKVHGEFMSSGREVGEDLEEIGGSLTHWVTPRSAQEELRTSLGSTEEFLYINPHCVDNIFYVAADSSQDTDHFLFNVNFAVNSVRPMSVLGLPRW